MIVLTLLAASLDEIVAPLTASMPLQECVDEILALLRTRSVIPGYSI
jgi:hypothetical protein